MGANATPYVTSTMKPGTVVTERSFVSTTANPKVPFEFDPETLFVINSRGGGRDISQVSFYEKEAEMLFRPNTRFKVLAVDDVAPNQDLFGKKDHLVKKIVYMDQLLT